MTAGDQTIPGAVRETGERPPGRGERPASGVSATTAARVAPEEVRPEAPSWHTNVLIVRPDAYRDESSNIVDSLEAALQRVATSAAFSVIELHFDQTLEQPRTVEVARRYAGTHGSGRGRLSSRVGLSP